MAKTGLEKILLSALNFNDAAKLSMESLVFTPGQAKSKVAENANADGVLLVEEPQFTPAYFDMQVRVIPAATTDAALQVVGEVVDVLTNCARTEDGAPVEWTPNETEEAYTAYALIGELLEIPITPDGELAGWFIRSPVLKIKLTCRPFLFREERKVLSATTSTKPTQVVFVGGIEGDVPAEARMVVANKVAKAMRFAEWGMDVVETEALPSLEFGGTVGLKYTGYIGESSTKTGSQSTNVIKAKLSTIPAAVCSTGTIEHVGSYEGKLRVFVSSTENELAIVFRVSYRAGNGSWISCDWIEACATNEWIEMDLQEVLLEEAEKGKQVSEIRIEAKCLEQATTSPYVYVDIFTLMPAKRRAVARAEIKYDVPAVLLAADSMSQTAGAATGKAMDIGGNYAVFTNSDADDFNITGSGKLKRTAISDTGTLGTTDWAKGRAVGPSTNKSGTLAIRTDFTVSSSSLSPLRFGHICCHTGDAQFILVCLQYFGSGHWECKVWNAANVYIGSGAEKFVVGLGGGSTTTASGSLITVIEGERITLWIAGEDGVYHRHFSGTNEQIGVTGRVGIYDENSGATAATREYDNFAVWTPEVPTVCEPSRALEIGSHGAIRQDSGGTYYTPVPNYRGGDLYLAPAGKAGFINRIASKIRRNDTKLEADENVTDERSVEIYARERFLVPR